MLLPSWATSWRRVADHKQINTSPHNASDTGTCYGETASRVRGTEKVRMGDNAIILPIREPCGRKWPMWTNLNEAGDRAMQISQGRLTSAKEPASTQQIHSPYMGPRRPVPGPAGRTEWPKWVSCPSGHTAGTNEATHRVERWIAEALLGLRLYSEWVKNCFINLCSDLLFSPEQVRCQFPSMLTALTCAY